MEQVGGKSIHVARHSKSSAASGERAPESSARRSSKPYSESSSVPQGNSTSISRNSTSTSSRSGGGGSSSSSRTAERRSSSSKSRPADSASSSSRRRQEKLSSVGIDEPTSPLPHGWSVAFSKSGRKYYANETDKTNTWEKPTCESPTEARTESNGSARPEGPHSSSTGGRDNSNGDRRQRSSSGDIEVGKSTRRVPRDVEETSGMDPTLAPPRKSRNARDATRGGDPPVLPARPSSSGRPTPGSSDALAASKSSSSGRPRGDERTGHSSRESASRPSVRGASSSSNGRRSKPRGDERDPSVENMNRAAGQLPGAGTGDESGEAAVGRSRVIQTSREAGDAARQTKRTASKDAPAQPDVGSFDPALFGMPPGMQLPVAVQEQLMKQFQAMPKQHQHMMLQQQAKAQQPTLYRGTPGSTEPMYSSGLSGELTKGMGKLMKKLVTTPTVKPRPKGYVGMTGGEITTPGSFSAKDLKKPKLKKPSSSASRDGKEDRDGTTIKMFNGMVKSSLNMVGLGEHCKLKLKKTKKGGLKWKGDVDVSDSDCEVEREGEEDPGIEGEDVEEGEDAEEGEEAEGGEEQEGEEAVEQEVEEEEKEVAEPEGAEGGKILGVPFLFPSRGLQRIRKR